MADKAGRTVQTRGTRPTNKYSTKKAAKDRIAAARAEQARRQRRRNALVATGGVGGVIVVVIVIVVVALATHHSTKAHPVVAASSTVASGVAAAATANLAADDFSQVTPPTTIDAKPALTAGGKPEVLYVGAEYCPFCAATRWPLAIALSRFGTFSNLKTTYSSATDQDPNTPTLSFHGSSYTSDYIAFRSVEQEDGLAKPLETATTAEESLFSQYGGSAYPFIDIGNSWMQSTAFDPALLAKMTPEQVAAAAKDGTGKAGAAIAGSANAITAAICKIDGGKPANVCTASGVQAAAGKLASG